MKLRKRNISELTLEEIKEQDEKKRIEEEQGYQYLLERFPPNKKFYSYSVPDDTTWRRLEELPSIELLDSVGAEQWTNGLIGGMGRMFNSFVITGVYHNSRVIEFEYVYDGKRLKSPLF